jgi:hypothetical protein
MPRCVGSKPDNSPCERVVKASLTYCFAHDPARKEARHRNASKAARSKPGREIKDLKVQLESLANDVLNESVEPKVGAVVNQILNTRARLIEVDRKLRETEELAREMESLREMVERDAGRGETRRSLWGA